MEQDNNQMNSIREFISKKRKMILALCLLPIIVIEALLTGASFLMGSSGVFLSITGMISILISLPIFFITQIIITYISSFMHLNLNLMSTLFSGSLITCLFLGSFTISYLLSGLFLSSYNNLLKTKTKFKARILIFIFGLILFFPIILSGPTTTFDSDVENAWRSGCNILKNTHNCKADKLTEIKVGDITGDGMEDSLLKACRKKFEDKTLSIYWCRNKCCNTIIQEGSECEVNADCHFRFGKGDWVCTNNHCCPSGRIWENDRCIEK